jgi:hypothetical protein
VTGGHFGDVFRVISNLCVSLLNENQGVWGKATEVALKQLKDKYHMDEFIHEASVLL